MPMEHKHVLLVILETTTNLAEDSYYTFALSQSSGLAYERAIANAMYSTPYSPFHCSRGKLSPSTVCKIASGYLCP